MHLVNDDHGHACHHGHCHNHGSAPQEKPENQDEALLAYMLQHNQSHAAELDQMSAKLREAGMEEAAEQVRKAVDEFEKGNLYLSVALAMVKEKK